MINELQQVPGVPETAIPEQELAMLPSNLAPAPWAVHSSGLVWFAKAPDAAAAALPPALLHRGAKPSFVIGGFVRYSQTPVGAYDEVFGVVGYRIGRSVGSTVAFMAVDSPISLVGGRTNWSMPKTLARFTGEPRPGATFTAEGENDLDWGVAATAGHAAPPLPIFSRAKVVQEFPDGSLRGCRLKARGLARLTRVDVSVHSAGSLPEWLEPGRHTGAVLDRIRFSLGDPSPV